MSLTGPWPVQGPACHGSQGIGHSQCPETMGSGVCWPEAGEQVPGTVCSLPAGEGGLGPPPAAGPSWGPRPPNICEAPGTVQGALSESRRRGPTRGPRIPMRKRDHGQVAGGDRLRSSLEGKQSGERAVWAGAGRCVRGHPG